MLLPVSPASQTWAALSRPHSVSRVCVCVCDCGDPCHWHVLKSGTLPWRELIHGSWQVASTKHCANSPGMCRSQIWKRHQVIIGRHEADLNGHLVFNQQHRFTLITNQLFTLNVTCLNMTKSVTVESDSFSWWLFKVIKEEEEGSMQCRIQNPQRNF